MKKFLVLYLCPAATMEEWMKSDPEKRKAGEEKMKAEWDAWMNEHGKALKETAGAGSTTKVTQEGVAGIKNDIMLFSIAEGESQEAVAKMFENHPHLEIPQASIEIMEVNYLPGME